MYLGLERKIANDCFDFSRYGEEVIRQGKKEPKLLAQTENTRLESLIGSEDTTCFSVDRFTVSGGSAVLTAGAGVHVVEDGEGTVRCGDFEHSLKKGDYFFLPVCAAGETTVEGKLNLLICKGGD